MSITIEQLAHELGQGKERQPSTGFDTLCPAHDDHKPSLGLSQTNGKILFHCHVGCTQESVHKESCARGLWPDSTFANAHSHNGAAPRLTLAEFATAKGFEPAFLTQMGVAEDKGRLVFHYLLMDGQRAARQRIRLSLTGDKRFIWNSAQGRPVPYGLWRLAEARKRNSALILVEGESDALTLWNHGIEALGIPGADMCGLLQAPHVAGFRRVFIVREDDHGGEIFEKGCVGRFAELEFDGTVAVVEMAKAAVKDVNDLHLKLLANAGGFEVEWEALIHHARTVELPIVGLEVFAANTIQAKKIEWLWPKRIPLGKLVLFVGHPGLGKSFTALDVAARLSTGAGWPDGSPGGLQGNSIVFSAEDGMADTIIPRLMALGAEPGRIWLGK
jgi:AAA domain